VQFQPLKDGNKRFKNFNEELILSSKSTKKGKNASRNKQQVFNSTNECGSLPRATILQARH
jgi:hypothetical protein